MRTLELREPIELWQSIYGVFLLSYAELDVLTYGVAQSPSLIEDWRVSYETGYSTSNLCKLRLHAIDRWLYLIDECVFSGRELLKLGFRVRAGVRDVGRGQNLLEV